tara:strand:+ start:2170 stop:2376 length:207 start_codon:yes stop_codon:yes gene_type:complete
MSLYDKLNEEAIKVLDQEMILYPYSTEALVTALKHNRYVLDLALIDAHRVSNVFGFDCTLVNIINFFE